MEYDSQNVRATLGKKGSSICSNSGCISSDPGMSNTNTKIPLHCYFSFINSPSHEVWNDVNNKIATLSIDSKIGKV